MIFILHRLHILSPYPTPNPYRNPKILNSLLFVNSSWGPNKCPLKVKTLLLLLGPHNVRNIRYTHRHTIKTLASRCQAQKLNKKNIPSTTLSTLSGIE